MFCIMLKEITSEELLNKSPKVQLIDIRVEYEYEEGYIKNSINIPMGDVLENLNKLDQTKDIIFYCNTGRRSKPVVFMLNKLHNIISYNLKGGYKNFLKIIAK